MSCTSCSTNHQSCGSCQLRNTMVGMSLVGAPITNAQAREIIRQAWQLEHGRPPTQSELDYTQAIALFETGYGRIGQFARLSAEGKFNWGALQRSRNPDGSCPAGTEPGSDSGNARCFFVFPTDVAAARRYIWELTKNPARATRVAATLDAMQNGTPEQVAAAMRIAPAWYETSVQNYAAAIRNGLRNIGSTAPVGRPVSSPLAPTGSSISLTPILLGGALGFGAWWVYTRYGTRLRRAAARI